MYEIDKSKAISNCCVLCPEINLRYGKIPSELQNLNKRTSDTRLDEAAGLALAIELDIVYSSIVKINEIRPATLFGAGFVNDFTEIIASNDIHVVLVDAPLSPTQQKKLEKAWMVKVIDRTGLILEIFAKRARTYEGRLQVELAQLRYQRSRLVKSWSHLERQRGGLSFVGGPGESQLEIDRRLIDERVTRIKKQLVKVQKTRSLHRKTRRAVPYPIVAIVGYTNAGKSTLFNKLTNANVMVEDMLFATLDPTMRALNLPFGKNKQKIILSDTVGFIADLPTELVAAFRATLEEVLEADIILHLRDIATENTLEQKEDVIKILSDLGVNENNKTIIEVLNKTDLLSNDKLFNDSFLENKITISALTGNGLDELYNAIIDKITTNYKEYVIKINIIDGAALAWLYQYSNVLKRKDKETTIKIKASMSYHIKERFKKQFNYDIKEQS